MSSKVKKCFAALAVTLMATALAGCGSGNREGAPPGGGSALFGNVATVGDTACVQCHSATPDAITGQSLVAEYQQTSPHNESGLGCESCHGGGAMHNGVGPIPYPFPDASRCATCHNGVQTLTVNGVETVAPWTNSNTAFATSGHAEGDLHTSPVCNRCHTNEGAVLGAANGLTGPTAILGNASYQNAVPSATNYNHLSCDTCHAHGGGFRTVKTRDASGNLVNWNPSRSNKVNDQFNLCTSCHNMLDNDGTTVIGSGLNGTVQYGPATGSTHYTRWNRILASTHYDNLDNTVNGISGYVVRKSGNNPCFDCHAHEAKTNTAAVRTDPTAATIYTDWAQSGHAGDLLSAKYTAAGGNLRTAVEADAVMQANTKDPAWGGDGGHIWSATSNADCQRCHTATGASNYLNSPATYDKTKNSFSHLAGWTASAGSKQSELLYCWGCHTNAAKGEVRNPGAISAGYNFNGAAAKFPSVAESNTCVACHSGRESGESLNAIADFTNASFKNSHYMAAAGMMYVKAGFTAFTDPSTMVPGTTNTYGKTLTSTDDGGSIGSTHRAFGTSAIVGNHGITASDTNMTSGGPCVTCHMNNGGGKAKHSLKIDAYAYDNVCVKCHTSEGSKTGPVALTSANFQSAFVEPNSSALQGALTLAKTVLEQNYKILYNPNSYPYFYDENNGNTAVKDWTRGGTLTQADAKKLMGACFNINLITREPAAYAHARTYTRRLMYDTIDWLDDRTMNLSAGTTALAVDPTDFQKGTNAYTDSTLGTIDPGTSEGMLFLLNWSRSTGKWNTSSERP